MNPGQHSPEDKIAYLTTALKAAVTLGLKQVSACIAHRDTVRLRLGSMGALDPFTDAEILAAIDRLLKDIPDPVKKASESKMDLRPTPYPNTLGSPFDTRSGHLREDLKEHLKVAASIGGVPLLTMTIYSGIYNECVREVGEAGAKQAVADWLIGLANDIGHIVYLLMPPEMNVPGITEIEIGAVVPESWTEAQIDEEHRKTLPLIERSLGLEQSIHVHNDDAEYERMKAELTKIIAQQQRPGSQN